MFASLLDSTQHPSISGTDWLGRCVFYEMLPKDDEYSLKLKYAWMTHLRWKKVLKPGPAHGTSYVFLLRPYLCGSCLYRRQPYKEVSAGPCPYLLLLFTCLVSSSAGSNPQSDIHHSSLSAEKDT